MRLRSFIRALRLGPLGKASLNLLLLGEHGSEIAGMHHLQCEDGRLPAQKLSKKNGQSPFPHFALIGCLLCATALSAQTLTTLVTFNRTDAAYPYAGLIADADGNLFGTTTGNYRTNYGTVFEIAKTASGYATAPTLLVTFNGADGAYPYAGLIADADGNLLGTTQGGGASGDGTVFELPKTISGFATKPTTLVSFNGVNRVTPVGGLIADANGNLFGTTQQGGALGLGTAFEIMRTATGYATTPTILVSFNGTNGQYPYAGLLADANGNFLGTTQLGGTYNDGTVFEITKRGSGYATTPTTLVSFNGTDGYYPQAGLIADADGNLFGTTRYGGTYSYGTVFEITRTASGYATTLSTLVSFSDGAYPNAGLIADSNGSLFGTTEMGGASGGGTVFEIARMNSGYATTPTTLVSFNGTNGFFPFARLIADANGDLFGTALTGGPFNAGTLFEITDSGFVPPVRFAGVPGRTDCRGVSISSLVQTYGGTSKAATALGYSSEPALQSAVTVYCAE